MQAVVKYDDGRSEVLAEYVSEHLGVARAAVAQKVQSMLRRNERGRVEFEASVTEDGIVKYRRYVVTVAWVGATYGPGV
jgi:hypothetical protein